MIGQSLFVAQIMLVSGQGWTSIHETEDGAAQALIGWAASNGVASGFPVATIDNFDLAVEVDSYGVSCLPVQR